MDYKLAKQLEDEGFPQPKDWYKGDYYMPTLEELIDATDNGIFELLDLEMQFQFIQ